MGGVLANGDWIWFIDADDYIAQHCIEYLISLIKKYPVELLYFDSVIVKKEDKVVFNNPRIKLAIIEGSFECMTSYPSKSYASGPWSYIFRKDIIVRNHIAFDESMKYSEDIKFVFQYKRAIKKALLIDHPFYYYVQREGSLLHKVDKVAHYISMKKLVDLYDEAFKEQVSDQEKYLFEAKRNQALRACQYDLLFDLRDYKEAKECLEVYTEKGIYPYKNKWPGKNKNKKQMIINIIALIYPYRRLYLFLVYIMSKTKG